jgi:hypothetical protein
MKRTVIKTFRAILTIIDKTDKALQLVTTLFNVIIPALDVPFLFGVAEKAFEKGCQSNSWLLK